MKHRSLTSPADLLGLSFPECVIQLQRLFDQIGASVSGFVPDPRRTDCEGRGPSSWRVQALNCLAFIPRGEYHTARLAHDLFPRDDTRLGGR